MGWKKDMEKAHQIIEDHIAEKWRNWPESSPRLMLLGRSCLEERFGMSLTDKQVAALLCVAASPFISLERKELLEAEIVYPERFYGHGEGI